MLEVDSSIIDADSSRLLTPPAPPAIPPLHGNYISFIPATKKNITEDVRRKRKILRKSATGKELGKRNITGFKIFLRKDGSD